MIWPRERNGGLQDGSRSVAAVRAALFAALVAAFVWPAGGAAQGAPTAAAVPVEEFELRLIGSCLPAVKKTRRGRWGNRPAS